MLDFIWAGNYDMSCHCANYVIDHLVSINCSNYYRLNLAQNKYSALVSDYISLIQKVERK